jgi:hypothetical protein
MLSWLLSLQSLSSGPSLGRSVMLPVLQLRRNVSPQPTFPARSHGFPLRVRYALTFCFVRCQIFPITDALALRDHNTDRALNHFGTSTGTTVQDCLDSCEWTGFFFGAVEFGHECCTSQESAF